MDWNYLAVILNSTIRSTTPVLLAALGSAVCSRAGIFNIALEGQMLISCFVTVAVDYWTGSLLLATLAGVASGALVGLIVAILQVKLKAADMVIGTSINLFVSGFTGIALILAMGVRGRFVDPKVQSLHKISLPLLKDLPFIGKIFENLTIIDYASYLIAFLLFIWMFRSVSGFHVRSVGVNFEAARSLGVKPLREQMKMLVLSGALCGLGGAVLCIGQVTMFVENMTAGRGFIAMAASTMGATHPLWIILSSLFFGFAQALGTTLQNNIPSQLTMTLPYIATIIALMLTGRKQWQRNKTKAERVKNNGKERVA